MEDYQKSVWWDYFEEPMKDLMKESFTQLAYEKGLIEQGGTPKHDYSFIVFSAAKAYEGFLKKLLYDAKLISRQQYFGDHFRLGKSLNPHLPKRYQYDWVFLKLANLCGGQQVPLLLWETWKHARNKIFHYFPDHRELISLQTAESLIREIVTAIDTALKTSGIIRIR
jgi:hypothetical protein